MGPGRLRLTVSIGLVVLTLLTYGPLWQNGFVDLDDEEVVVKNNFVNSGGLTISKVAWAWTTFHYGNWIPLTWMSLQLDASLSSLLNVQGGDQGPLARIIHGQNLLWHTATVVLLFLTLDRLTGSLWRSTLVAALFGVHPLHVESVAWATERKDVLSAFFWVLTLLLYARYAHHASWGRYLLVVGTFVLGLLAKPMLVSLPFVLLLLDWWPLRRWPAAGSGRLLSEKVPLFAVTAAACVVAFVAQKHAGSVQALTHIAVPDRLANAVVSYGWYLEKTFWPVDLTAFYTHPKGSWHWSTVLAASSVLSVWSVVAVSTARSLPWLLFGWLWFLGTLVPVIGLVQVGEQAYADRYAYLPHIGLFVALVWSAGALSDRLRLSVWLRGGLATACLLLLTSLTWIQVGYWRNAETLWAHAVQATADNHFATYCQGRRLYFLGKQTGDPVLLARAQTYFAKANALAPDQYRYLGALGQVLLDQGQLAESRDCFQRLTHLFPTEVWALKILGTVQRRQGQLDEAVRTFREALELNPTLADSRTELGQVLWQLGQRDQAAEEWREALQYDPRQQDALNELGLVSLSQGRNEDALRRFRVALEENHNFIEAWSNQGMALGRLEQWRDASQSQEMAVQLQAKLHEERPNAATAADLACYLRRWAMSLHAQGSVDEAATRYAEATKLDPGWPRTNLDRAWKLATSPDPSLRDAMAAWDLTRQVCQASTDPTAEALDAQAAALAALGRFQEAVQTAQRALVKGGPFAEAVKARMELYRMGKAYVRCSD